MEVMSIAGDIVQLLYHPAESAADVGQQFAVMEADESGNGLIVQIIANESLEYAGQQQEMIQSILEERVADHTHVVINHESDMGDIKNLKKAIAKIRKRVTCDTWAAWDGWIPTRNVVIAPIPGGELLAHIMPAPDVALESFCKFADTAVDIDGRRLDMVNVVAGVKGSGKSHLAKHLLLAMAGHGVPCVVFDVNGEYVNMPDVQVLRWGDNFRPHLADVGPDALITLVAALSPLGEGTPSQSTFETRVRPFFAEREKICAQKGIKFAIDIKHLQEQTWSSGNTFVENAIQDRLALISSRELFWDRDHGVGALVGWDDYYSAACDGHPLVFDMRNLSISLQKALARVVNQATEASSRKETASGQRRYPYVFYEEAHFYVSENAILNAITLGRHIGIASVFVTNTPQKLPDAVFRQLDNLFLMSLTHRDDISNVSRNSFTDEQTVVSFATRMPVHHALMMGRVTDRYPLLVEVDPLPQSVPATGQTRSTWDRFVGAEH